MVNGGNALYVAAFRNEGGPAVGLIGEAGGIRPVLRPPREDILRAIWIELILLTDANVLPGHPDGLDRGWGWMSGWAG